MYKDFDKWNEKKKWLENRQKSFLFKEGDIWWCSVGINVAVESCGKGKDFQRPVLVYRKLSKYSFIGLPITTKPKFGDSFCEIEILNARRWVLLAQIRAFSVNRFQHRILMLDKKNFTLIKQKLKQLLEF